jgi:hypothetical protein
MTNEDRRGSLRQTIAAVVMAGLSLIGLALGWWLS